MKKFNKEKELIESYLNGNSIKDITNTFKINPTTIYNILHRNNTKLKNSLSIDENIIINEYLNSNNISDISRKYNISFSKIKNILINNDIDTSKPFRKYSVDECYFGNINSYDKAYFLGLLYADGYINHEGFYLSLCETDIDILESFKSHIKYNGSIKSKTYKNRNHCNQKQLNIFSKKLASDLILLGCVQNKSHIVKYPNFLSKKYRPHFIRGVFDGDGSVFKSRQSGVIGFSIIGNYNLIRGILDVLIEDLRIKDKTLQKDKRCNGDIVSFKISSKKELILIYNYLYNNSENIRINRKFNKFKLFLYEKGLL